MRVKILARLTLLSCVIGILSGCGESPVEVRLEPSEEGHVTHVVISGVVDDVQLKGFTINRGNCTGSFFEKGRHLKFGESSKIYGGCHINEVKEVEIDTDQGEYTFTF